MKKKQYFCSVKFRVMECVVNFVTPEKSLCTILGE